MQQLFEIEKSVLNVSSSLFPIVKDFRTFIEYVEVNKPILTAKGEVLGKKDCFNLNSLLSNQLEVEKASLNQNKYPLIHLIFTLSLDSNLYYIGLDYRNKLSLIPTPLLDTFKKYNEFEQYVFLLGCYWTQYNYPQIEMYTLDALGLVSILGELASEKVDHMIFPNESNKSLFQFNQIVIQHLEFLGLCQNIQSNKTSIQSINGTKLGKKAATILFKHGLSVWNYAERDFLLQCLQLKIKKISQTEFLNQLKKLFSEKDVQHLSIEQVKASPQSPQLYTLKISLSPSVFRRIQIASHHSLQDLHHIILKAYSFYGDHCFEFNLGNTRKGTQILYTGTPMGMHHNIKLSEANLKVGKLFYYLYDFGAEWNIKIQVEQIEEMIHPLLKPKIISTVGKSPEEYDY